MNMIRAVPSLITITIARAPLCCRTTKRTLSSYSYAEISAREANYQYMPLNYEQYYKRLQGVEENCIDNMMIASNSSTVSSENHYIPQHSVAEEGTYWLNS